MNVYIKFGEILFVLKILSRHKIMTKGRTDGMKDNPNPAQPCGAIMIIFLFTIL